MPKYCTIVNQGITAARCTTTQSVHKIGVKLGKMPCLMAFGGGYSKYVYLYAHYASISSFYCHILWKLARTFTHSTPPQSTL